MITLVTAGLLLKALKNGVNNDLTSSRCAMADLWKRVKWLLQDHGEGVSAHKIKAHMTRAKALEEGGIAGVINWVGNDAADNHAKLLARSRWETLAPGETEIRAQRDRLRQHVRRAAIIFRAAQRRLDNAGIPKVPRRAARQVCRGAKAECGDHLLQFDGVKNSWSCVRCRLIANTATSRRSLAQRRCNGELADRIPVSHQLQFSAGVLWCRRCGAYTTRLPRALARECPGQAPSAAAANVLRRLGRGLPPTTAVYLAPDRWASHGRGDGDAASLHRALGDGQFQPSPQPTLPRAPSQARHLRGGPSPQLHGPSAPGIDSRPEQEEVRDDGDEHEHVQPRAAVARRAASVPQAAARARRAEAALTDQAIWGGASSQRGRQWRCGGSSRQRDSRSQADAPAAIPETAPPLPPPPGRATLGGSRADGASDNQARRLAMHTTSGTREAARDGLRRSAVAEPCSPMVGASWSSRLLISSIVGASACHKCGSDTRSTCRGCTRRLCLRCAKARIWCNVESVSERA